MYGVTLTCTAVLFNVLWRYAAAGRRLLKADADQRVIDGISRSYVLGPLAYGAATVAALAARSRAPPLYAAISLFYFVESSVFGRTAG